MAKETGKVVMASTSSAPPPKPMSYGEGPAYEMVGVPEGVDRKKPAFVPHAAAQPGPWKAVEKPVQQERAYAGSIQTEDEEPKAESELKSFKIQEKELVVDASEEDGGVVGFKKRKVKTGGDRNIRRKV